MNVALFAIARATFDVPLAQSVADAALAQLEQAGFTVIGTRGELLMDPAAADRAVSTLAGLDFDLTILLQASFADSAMAVQIAQAVQPSGVPLLLWAVPDRRDGGRLRLNSLCGINLAGHALTQQRVAYDYLHAAASDPAALEKVGQLARAGRARRFLRSARIGLVGEHPAGFTTCAYDSADLRQIFGVEVAPLALSETLEQAAAAGVDRRTAFLDRVASHADNLDDLDQTALNGTAGVYAVLRDAADQRKLDGLAVRCWPEFFTELGCAACGAMSMLTEERCPASCEADVNGTLTSLLLQAIGDTQAFITDLVSIEAESDSGVLWHCGLAPVSMADPAEPVQGTVHSNRKLPLLFEFALRPGRVTLARLHRVGVEGGVADYRLVIGGGVMLRAPRAFSGTSGVIRFDRPAGQVLDRIMRHGLEHHFSIVYGDYRAELRAFARLVELPVIELT